MPTMFSGPATGLLATLTWPAVGRPKAGHYFHQRGFSATGRPDDGNEFALLDFEARPVQSKRRLLVVVTKRDVLKSNEAWHKLSPTYASS